METFSLKKVAGDGTVCCVASLCGWKVMSQHTALRESTVLYVCNNRGRFCACVPHNKGLWAKIQCIETM